MDTNPTNQIKLVAIYSDKISKKNTSKNNPVFSILESMVNNSLVSCRNSVYLKYFDSLYSDQFKRVLFKHINFNIIDDSFKITKKLTSRDQNILVFLLLFRMYSRRKIR